MRLLQRIIVHCSDSDIPEHDNIETIERWHRARGFEKVGYHFFIRKDGEIQKGREVEEIGAHCTGFNSDSIAICLSGRKEFRYYQFLTLHHLIAKLIAEHGSIIEIHGHRFYTNKKTCPNFDVDAFVIQYMPSFVNSLTAL